MNEKLINNNDKAIIDLICQKEKDIKILKSIIPFDVKENEILMSVVIQSAKDQTIYSFICTDQQKFIVLVDKLYEKMPKYQDTQNYFITNARPINERLTLRDNGIKDGDVILMYIKEENIE